jgi:hypothetical protein
MTVDSLAKDKAIISQCSMKCTSIFRMLGVKSNQYCRTAKGAGARTFGGSLPD